MNKVRKLPGPVHRYFVEEPLMMVPIGEYEQIVNHLTSMANIDSYDEKQASVLKQQHRLLVVATREKLKEAKAHYHIKN